MKVCIAGDYIIVSIYEVQSYISRPKPIKNDYACISICTHSFSLSTANPPLSSAPLATLEEESQQCTCHSVQPHRAMATVLTLGPVSPSEPSTPSKPAEPYTEGYREDRMWVGVG